MSQKQGKRLRKRKNIYWPVLSPRRLSGFRKSAAFPAKMQEKRRRVIGGAEGRNMVKISKGRRKKTDLPNLFRIKKHFHSGMRLFFLHILSKLSYWLRPEPGFFIPSSNQ